MAKTQESESHPSAEKLKLNLANAFGVPDHLANAWNAWVDSVEERLGKSRTHEG